MFPAKDVLHECKAYDNCYSNKRRGKNGTVFLRGNWVLDYLGSSGVFCFSPPLKTSSKNKQTTKQINKQVYINIFLGCGLY